MASRDLPTEILTKIFYRLITQENGIFVVKELRLANKHFHQAIASVVEKIVRNELKGKHGAYSAFTKRLLIVERHYRIMKFSDSWETLIWMHLFVNTKKGKLCKLSPYWLQEGLAMSPDLFKKLHEKSRVIKLIYHTLSGEYRVYSVLCITYFHFNPTMNLRKN